MRLPTTDLVLSQVPSTQETREPNALVRRDPRQACVEVLFWAPVELAPSVLDDPQLEVLRVDVLDREVYETAVYETSGVPDSEPHGVAREKRWLLTSSALSNV